MGDPEHVDIEWVHSAAEAIAGTAADDLMRLVAVSSPSGDVGGAELAVAVALSLLPAAASVERLDCSSPGHARDLLARVTGTGSGRLLLLGHLDTVVAHAEHRPLERAGDVLLGSGTIDMKAGVVLALGVMRVIARLPDTFAELALLLVVDEEWRTAPFAHAERFAGWEGCMCFEAGERTAQGAEGVVLKRKAAGTLRVVAHGTAAHSGSAPDEGRNALLALAHAARVVAESHDPHGPARLTAVPTVLHSGEAFNVVPAAGELFCDLRAEDATPFYEICESLPQEVGGARLEPELIRVWPGMDTRERGAPVLAAASALLGRSIVGVRRGGASDASHLATSVPLTLDGLGPRGGGAHTPGEFVRPESLAQRSEVALAVAAAVLGLIPSG